jgi:nuclear pore complex protein Nup53
MHVQYQTKYGAQRALLRSGEQLSSTLIIGVKQLEPQHRALVEAYGAGANGSPGPRLRAPQQGPLRPYRVDVSGAQALPQRSRTLVQKLSEFVLGI